MQFLGKKLPKIRLRTPSGVGPQSWEILEPPLVMLISRVPFYHVMIGPKIRQCSVINCGMRFDSSEAYWDHVSRFDHSPCNPCLYIKNGTFAATHTTHVCAACSTVRSTAAYLSGFPLGRENLEKWEGIFRLGIFEQTEKETEITQNTTKIRVFQTNVIYYFLVIFKRTVYYFIIC